MSNQETEGRLYTYIGQCILDSMTNASIQDWELAILNIGTGNGVKNFKLEYKYGGKLRDVYLVEDDIDSVIEELLSYTNNNGYKKWNRLRFELSPSHRFNVDYLWDEEIEKNYQILLSPRWR